MSDAPQGPGWWQASDGRFYPPQPQPQAVPQPPAVPPPPPSSGGNLWKVLLVIVGVIVLIGGCSTIVVAVALDDAVEEASDAFDELEEQADEFARQTGPADEADFDVTEPTCVNEEIGGVQARGDVTNTSDERQGFEIKVRFLDGAGDLLSADSTFTDPLDPGQSTGYLVYALGAPSGAEVTGLTCEIEAVNYTIFDDQGAEPGN